MLLGSEWDLSTAPLESAEKRGHLIGQTNDQTKRDFIDDLACVRGAAAIPLRQVEMSSEGSAGTAEV